MDLNSINIPSTSGTGDNKRKKSPEKKKNKTKQMKMSDYITSFPTNEDKKEKTQQTVIPRDWRQGFGLYSSIRNKARKGCMFTDIQFVMGKGDQRKTFHAHKVMLACASPVFECMFYGSMADNRTVIETDDDPEVFDMLLDYIYEKGSEIEANSLILAWKFFMLADKYLVYNIEKKAKHCIKKAYEKDENFWDVIQDKNFKFLCPLLYDNFLTFIREDTYDFIIPRKFLKAPETIVETVLKMDRLKISEYELLIEITVWAEHNKQPITPEVLKQYYKHIRFSTLSSQELLQFFEKYPKALEAETYLEILRHTHGKSGHNLPAWCSANKKSRKALYNSPYY